jgi:hypothetical protein
MPPASQRGRPVTTLVDVVVIVWVLGAIAFLVLPALVSPRGPDGRSSCMNDQKELAFALAIYEDRHRRLPGYVNRFETGAEQQRLAVSRIVPLLDYAGRRDLWEHWIQGEPVAPRLEQLICPLDPSGETDADIPVLSYVVNCGQPGDEDTPATGVFYNHTVAEPVTLSFKDIKDGASYTLMISENVQAGRWTDTDEADVGMVWFDEPDECSHINRCLDAGDRPQDVRYARPSSHHSDAVIVTFCDCHIAVLREDIDYTVYQHLMTPDSKAAGIEGELDDSMY